MIDSTEQTYLEAITHRCTTNSWWDVCSFWTQLLQKHSVRYCKAVRYCDAHRFDTTQHINSPLKKDVGNHGSPQEFLVMVQQGTGSKTYLVPSRCPSVRPAVALAYKDTCHRAPRSSQWADVKKDGRGAIFHQISGEKNVRLRHHQVTTGWAGQRPEPQDTTERYSPSLSLQRIRWWPLKAQTAWPSWATHGTPPSPHPRWEAQGTSQFSGSEAAVLHKIKPRSSDGSMINSWTATWLHGWHVGLSWFVCGFMMVYDGLHDNLHDNLHDYFYDNLHDGLWMFMLWNGDQSQLQRFLSAVAAISQVWHLNRWSTSRSSCDWFSLRFPLT